MSWRTCGVSPARMWVICGALARRDFAVAAAITAEELAAARIEGLIHPKSLVLTDEGHKVAALRDTEVSWRQQQWKLHGGRS